MDRYFGRAGGTARTTGSTWARYLCVYSARTELDRGRWAAAARAIPPTVERPGSVLRRIGALVVLGLLRKPTGRPGPWVLLDEAAELADRSGELQWTAPVCAARAEAAWLGGADDVETDRPASSRRASTAGPDGERARSPGGDGGNRRARPVQRRRALGAPAGGCGPAAAAAWRRRLSLRGGAGPGRRATADDSAGPSPASTRSAPARPRRSSLGGCVTPGTGGAAACARPPRQPPA
jgi:hypothetical protein